jgi:hypothetical protein
MADSLAGGADDTGHERTTTLVRSDRATTRIVALAIATGATIAEAIAALPMITETEAVETVVITTPRREANPSFDFAALSEVPALPTVRNTVTIAVAALLEAKNTGLVPLNVAERKFVVVDEVPHGFHTVNFVDTRRGILANVSFGIVVDHGGQTTETKLLWDTAVILVLSE